MKPIDVIFIVIAIGIVVGVALLQHRKRSKGQPTGGCSGCSGCSATTSSCCGDTQQPRS